MFSDIGLYSVGVTDEIDEPFLAAISGDIGVTNGNQVLGYDYFKAPDFQALDTMLETVSTGICDNPKPSKCTIFYVFLKISCTYLHIISICTRYLKYHHRITGLWPY